MALSAMGTAVFIMTRQPYAAILSLALLMVKGVLMGHRREIL